MQRDSPFLFWTATFVEIAPLIGELFFTLPRCLKLASSFFRWKQYYTFYSGIELDESIDVIRTKFKTTAKKLQNDERRMYLP